MHNIRYREGNMPYRFARNSNLSAEASAMARMMMGPALRGKEREKKGVWEIVIEILVRFGVDAGHATGAYQGLYGNNQSETRQSRSSMNTG